jgi:hypothetical protein
VRQLALRLVPRSLRARLLVAMCAVLLLVLGLLLTGHAAMLKRQQTGTADSMLRVIAHQILLSLPAHTPQIAAQGSQPGFRLPPELAETQAQDDDGWRKLHDKADWQVWSASGQLVLRSPGAPLQPYLPLQRDGFDDSHAGGKPWRAYSVRDADGQIVVQVACSGEWLQAELTRWAAISTKAAVVVFLMLATAVWFVICWSLRPAERLQRDIAERDAMAFAPFPTGGLPHELAPLVDAFNGLLQRLEGSVQSERRFIADAAHELRTPLAALLAQAEVARAIGDAAGRDAALARLAEGVARCTRVAEQLLDSARLDAGGAGLRRQRVWLYEIVEVVARDFEAAARARPARAARARRGRSGGRCRPARHPAAQPHRQRPALRARGRRGGSALLRRGRRRARCLALGERRRPGRARVRARAHLRALLPRARQRPARQRRGPVAGGAHRRPARRGARGARRRGRQGLVRGAAFRAARRRRGFFVSRAR